MQREVFAKVLTKNDDSGRHGVLIPEAAYSFFPVLWIPDVNKNATAFFELKDVRTGVSEEVAWKYYERYPERRITRVNSDINRPGLRIVVFRRLRQFDGTDRYEFEFSASKSEFELLAKRYFSPLGVAPEAGAFVRSADGVQPFVQDDALKEVLRRFDTFRSQWIESRRSGPTGLGYTFESLMGVEENNDRRADLLGIELKAKLKKTKDRSEGKTNLFQQGPEWTPQLSGRELIRKIGQPADDGLWSCYSAVTVATNNLGLYIAPVEADSRVDLNKLQDPIGFWSFSTLEKRLIEKHSRAVFVKAQSSIRADSTRYSYGELVYCERPRLENFISLVKSGDILFEFTMSEKANGTIRNHGYPWRLKDQGLLDQLFSFSVKLRD